MSEEAKKILEIIEDYLEKNPEVRFGQALFNLGINEFADKINPENKDFLLKDIHNDKDKAILDRLMKNKNG